MRNDRHLATKLRKKGMCYNKISKELDIPKSTMCYWFKNEPWSQGIKKELTAKALCVAKKRLGLINKARKEKWERWREEHRQDAKREYSHLKKDPLFLAGLMLYWGEGDSNIKSGSVRLSNTDPEMIRIFSLFLQKSCKILSEKIKMHLILYPDLNDDYCKKFWSQTTNVSENQFVKTSFIKGRHQTKKLSHGICLIYVSSRGLKEKMFTWLKLYQKEFE